MCPAAWAGEKQNPPGASVGNAASSDGPASDQRCEVTGGCGSGLRRLWSFLETTEASPNVPGLSGADDGACWLRF